MASEADVDISAGPWETLLRMDMILGLRNVGTKWENSHHYFIWGPSLTFMIHDPLLHCRTQVKMRIWIYPPQDASGKRRFRLGFLSINMY